MVSFKSDFPEVPSLSDINVHDFMFTLPGRTPEKDYVLHVDGISGKTVLRSEFVERVRDGAAALSAPESSGGFGINAPDGEIVGIFSHNALDYVTLVHSLLYIATPFALLSAHSTAFELTHGLRTADVTRLFVQPRLLQTALQAAKEVGLPEDRIYILGGSPPGRKSFGEAIDDVRARKIPRIPVRPAKRDTLAYLVFSSGTTGLPKAVMISHGNINFTLAQTAIMAMVDPRPETTPVALAFLPMYHTYGLHMFCFRGFLAPLTTVIVPKWNIDLILKVIREYRINILYLIPSAVHQLVQNKNLRQEIFSSVTTIVSGAAYLPPELVDEFRHTLGQPIEYSEGFGMSELTISATRVPTVSLFDGRIPHVPGSVGILLPGMEGRIVRDDGSDAPVGESGELWLRGGNVALGYWKNEAATRATFVEDGWLKTGDHFRVDELGRLFALQDTLKVSGAQVSPTEIESVLTAHPHKLVVDACVGGVSGGRTSDERVPRAWVVLSDEGRKRGVAQALQELETWARKNLSSYKWLRGGIEAIHEIPKSPTGKVLRRKLQDQYEAQRLKSITARL
ncbi:hypothetical protein IEO21_03788 [Rhodonia placenta]|uniref:Acetyl-CoA synthetase-like protein n=1 Tax=Rhodonia placenta TaxID=104341 RepID=A0A8H7P5I9_9APHY|nr:hypothetical protein IEO21_03788 [Postia placenta]